MFHIAAATNNRPATPPKHKQKVLPFVAKVMCNLASSSPNRKQMVHAGLMPVLMDALNNLLVNEHGSFGIKKKKKSMAIAQDLLTTLSQMSYTTCVPPKQIDR